MGDISRRVCVIVVQCQVRPNDVVGRRGSSGSLPRLRRQGLRRGYDLGRNGRIDNAILARIDDSGSGSRSTKGVAHRVGPDS